MTDRESWNERRDQVARYRLMEQETTDPLAAALLHDIGSELEANLVAEVEAQEVGSPDYARYPQSRRSGFLISLRRRRGRFDVCRLGDSNLQCGDLCFGEPCERASRIASKMILECGQRAYSFGASPMCLG